MRKLKPTTRILLLTKFINSYDPFIDLNQFTIATEIFPTHIRNQASAVAISGLFLANILWLNLLPTATANIGWKYYLVFVCLAVVHTIYLIFYLPEVCEIRTIRDYVLTHLSDWWLASRRDGSGNGRWCRFIWE